MSEHRAMSRRAFFKAAGIASAAAAVPGYAGADGPAILSGFPASEDDIKRLAKELSDKAAWEEAGGMAKEHKWLISKKKYIEATSELWVYFRFGTDVKPLDEGKTLKEFLVEVFDYGVDKNEKGEIQGSGKKFVDNLRGLREFGKDAVETRYCCYRCGYHALEDAIREDKEKPTISFENYKVGWGKAKDWMIAIHDRAGSPGPYGGGC